MLKNKIKVEYIKKLNKICKCRCFKFSFIELFYSYLSNEHYFWIRQSF